MRMVYREVLSKEEQQIETALSLWPFVMLKKYKIFFFQNIFDYSKENRKRKTCNKYIGVKYLTKNISLTKKKKIIAQKKENANYLQYNF